MIRPVPESAARYVAGRPARKTNGSAPAGMSGTHSTREAFAQPVFTTGLRLSASRAADGQRIRIGMQCRFGSVSCFAGGVP
jgi:hypothetical protein